jgi:acyl-CoA synthetase (AMP-forming)/AMP-acid ligase II
MVATKSTTTTTNCTLLLDRLEENEGKDDADDSKKAFSFLGSGLDGGRITKSCTYRELGERTTSLAKYLLTCTGLKKGDRYVLTLVAVDALFVLK